MALKTINSISIRGMAACVPSKIEENSDYSYFDENELDRIIPTIGVERRRVLSKGQTCGDLAYEASKKLLCELGWEKETIDLLLFCSPDRDHILPDTACIIHGKLGLPKTTMAFDMTLGCTGWTYAMTTACSLLESGFLKRALVLVGNHATYECAYEDKTAYPLFSDTGVATAIEYNTDSPSIYCQLGTDGLGYKAIIVPDGGARNWVTEDSLVLKEYGKNIKRNKLQMEMDGMEVFSFAMKTAPASVTELLDYCQIDKDKVDYFFFHQANFYMVKKIIKKLKINPNKAPFSMVNYGNTGASSIPLTMITEKANELRNKKLINVGCSFGVGLSWASLLFETDHLVIPEIIEY